MDCTRCHTPLNSGATACHVCGFPVPIALAPPSSASRPQQPPRTTTQGDLLPFSIRAQPSGLFSFLHRIRCPYCSWEFHPGECAIYSEDNEGKHILLQRAPSTGLQRIIARLRVQSLGGVTNTQKDARRACPRCQKLLPRGFELNKTYTIAVIGDTLSGKSHFLTTVLHQLKVDVARDQGDLLFRFEPLSNDTSLKFREFEQQLFGKHEMLPLTRYYTRKPGTDWVEWDPLIFGLEIGYRFDGVYKSNLINLVFYDIAGEDITQEAHLRHFGWPIWQADGIVHIADPLSMSRILNDLPPSDQVTKAKSIQRKLRTEDILAKVIQICTQFRNKKLQESVDIPVAIMLSKSDVLDPIVPPMGLSSQFLLQAPVYTGRVNLGEMAAVDREVRQLLATVGELGLVRESVRFTTSQFFAASATGCAPDADSKYPDVKPRRCLDPIFWLLWQLMSTRK